jgi:putative FmdB family regulatory protein
VKPLRKNLRREPKTTQKEGAVNAMPMYVFKCKKEECGETHNKIQKYEDAPPPCPKCQGETERVLGQTSFVLKGSGWFKTGGY